MSNLHTQSGFSAVELLITLFVVAAFLATGYQLYSVIIQDSGEAQQKAIASNLAYDYLRRTTPPTSCIASTPVNNTTLTHEKLGSIRILVTISCPQPTIPTLSKIQSTVKYGSGYTKEVTHAIFANQ